MSPTQCALVICITLLAQTHHHTIVKNTKD